MKKIFAIFFILNFLLMSTWAVAKGRSGKSVKALYPRVQNVLGKVYVVSEALTIEKRSAQLQERERLLKNGEILKDKARLRAGENSEAELQLSDGSRITILQNSEVNIPGISWDKGAVFQINLLSGKIRASCSKDCHRNFSNPLFDAVLPQGDFVFAYDPKIPAVSLQVLEGESSFRGLGNESELTIKEGEMATFIGIFEEGEPAYDVLLKGRKVAKGQATGVLKIPADEISQWKSRDELVKKKIKSAAQALVAKRTAAQICDQPYGELGQCSWKCENNPKKAKDCAIQNGAICVRTRCDANGTWSDRAELSTAQSRCGIKPVVEACDY